MRFKLHRGVGAGLFLATLSSCVGNLGVRSADQGRTVGVDGGGAGPAFTLPPPPAVVATPDARVCGFETLALDPVPPWLMLVLDRSSSMARAPAGAPAGTTLWTETLDSLDEVVRVTQSQIKWGLKLFPSPSGCEVADVPEVPAALNNSDPVLARVRGDGYNMSGVNGTPTADAITKAVAYLGTLPNDNPKSIVLATDGEPSCPAGNTLQAQAFAVEAVQAAALAGFKTYVIGIAIVGEATGVLNELALAGGVPRPDPLLRFHPVANRADLSLALTDIARKAASCSFALSKPPPAPDSVKITVGGTRVPESSSDGWSYTTGQHTAIVLNGSWCERAQAVNAQIDIVFGCPGIVVP